MTAATDGWVDDASEKGLRGEERQSSPVSVARKHAGLTRAVRRGFAVAALPLRSPKWRGALARQLRSWRPYVDGTAPVAVHAPATPWVAGQRRLLLVTHELSQTGAPRVVLEVARVFRESGWFVTVVAPVDGPFRDEMARHATVVVDPTALLEWSPLLRVMAKVSDLVLCNTMFGAGAVVTLAGAVPTAWYLHEVAPLAEALAAHPQPGRALAAARWVLAGSEMPAATVRDRRPDVIVLPYGVRRLAASSAVAAPGAANLVRIAVFASIEPRKGQDLAVAAIAALAPVRAGLRLTLYGRRLDADFASEVEAAASALPVVFGGELSTGDYAAAMAGADIVLVSSREDTLPLVSLDALATGRLLVCTPATGTSAWLEDGVSGFIAEAVTADALADALRRAWSRRDDWADIGAAGGRLFDAAFSEQAFAATLLSLAAEPEEAAR